MNKTRYISMLASILFLGALFFATNCNAQEYRIDTNNTIKDTLAYSDSLKQDNAPLQESDSLNIADDGDTVIVTNIEDSLTLDELIHIEHSPRRATILSAVFPGLGQIYNKKYWKVPIIYVAGGTILYFYATNNEVYQEYKELYTIESNKPLPNQDLLTNYSLNRDQFREYRDWNIIFLGLLYTANIIDAMVDAYFYNFDVSEQLSFNVEPQIRPSPYLTSNFMEYRLKLTMNF